MKQVTGLFLLRLRYFIISTRQYFPIPVHTQRFYRYFLTIDHISSEMFLTILFIYGANVGNHVSYIFHTSSFVEDDMEYH